MPGPLKVKERSRRAAKTDNFVRADFLRFLLLGGDELTKVHERGVMLYGAFVTGTINLNGCSISGGLMLSKCYFSHEFIAQDAKFGGVVALAGSYLARGLIADRMKSTVSVFLRNGFTSMGGVRLLGAQIGGNLDCSGSHFVAKEGVALNAERINVSGNVHLNNCFVANGSVEF